MSNTSLVTRAQFEYSILAEYGEYANNIAKRLKIVEVKESELRSFKLATIAVEAIRSYFEHYDGNTAPANDVNGLKKAEIESIVQLFNAILNTNYWYTFPDDI